MNEQKQRTQTQWGGRPIGGAAFGGASVFFVSIHFLLPYEYLWIFLIYPLYIPYNPFPKYVLYISLCVFLNLWSQD